MVSVPLVGPETAVVLIDRVLPSSSPSLANKLDPFRIISSFTLAESLTAKITSFTESTVIRTTA